MRLAKALGNSIAASQHAHELLTALDRAEALDTSPWRQEAQANE